MKSLLVLSTLAMLTAPAFAEDAMSMMPPTDLPAICLANAPATSAGSGRR